MADVTLLGATYSDVPAVDLPTPDEGTARFYDPSAFTYVESVNGSSGVVTLTIPPTMTVLSYGHSTWADFLAAYNSNTIVYCRASSNSNPGTGTQGRMAFMAYLSLNSNSVPTEVEFQYYRSVSSHSASQQGDQVFIYKLNSSGTWSVTTREAMSKIATGAGVTSSYSNGTITLKASILKATLTTGGWADGEQTVSVSGVTASNNVIVAPAPASSAEWAACGVMCTAQGAGTLTFTCTTTPTASVVANVLVGG